MSAVGFRDRACQTISDYAYPIGGGGIALTALGLAASSVIAAVAGVFLVAIAALVRYLYPVVLNAPASARLQAFSHSSSVRNDIKGQPAAVSPAIETSVQIRGQVSLSHEHFRLLPEGVGIPEPSQSIDPNQLLIEIQSLPDGFSYYSEYQDAPLNRESMLKVLHSKLTEVERNNQIQKLLKHFLIFLRSLSAPDNKMVAIQGIEWFKCPDRLMKDLKRSYFCTNSLSRVLDLPNAMRQKVLEMRRETFAIAVSKVLDPIFDARPCGRNKTHYTSSYNYYDRIFRMEFGLGGDPHEPASPFEDSRYYDQTTKFNYICDQAHTNQIRAQFRQIYTGKYVLERMLEKLNNAPGYSDLCKQCIEYLRAHYAKLLEEQDVSNGFTHILLSKILTDCGLLLVS